MESLRPKPGYNVIFEPIPEEVSMEEIAKWQTEVEALWEGWDVEWKKVADRQWGITCKLKEDEDGKTKERNYGIHGIEH